MKSILGWSLVKNYESEPQVQLLEKINELNKLRDRNERLLKENLKLNEHKPFIKIDMGDPSPKDVQQRESYVAAVAGFHTDYLKPKIDQMLSAAHNLGEEASNPRDVDLVLKGAMYTFREFLLWGKSMTNEHLSNLEASKDKDKN